MDDFDRWKTVRTPPPGGADRLLRALAAPSAARAPRRWVVPASIATACSLCVAAVVALHVRDAPRVAFERALQASLAEAERAAERSAPAPLRELPSSRPDVRILLLEPVAAPSDDTLPHAARGG